MLDTLAKTHMSQLKGLKSPFTKDEDRELILRFFALSNGLKSFKTPLYKFLNSEIQQNQHLDTEAVRAYSTHFRKSFDLVRPLPEVNQLMHRYLRLTYHAEPSQDTTQLLRQLMQITLNLLTVQLSCFDIHATHRYGLLP